MDCTSLQAILSGERADDLDVAESQAFEAHLRACEGCRDALARGEDELAPLVERMEPPALPAGAWDRVTKAVQADAARPALVVHGGGGGGSRLVAIAAAFLLAVGLGALLPLDLLRGLSPDGALSTMPSAPPVQRTAPDTTSGGRVKGSRVEVQALEFDGRRFDAMALVYDCGDEEVVLITVRDL
ncbi:MAG: hypothetical protein M9894_34805 [Planctomycetes bacterium]|nr:hypothetical protein [Planctomycetota bacterium]